MISFPDQATLRARGTMKWATYPDEVLPLWVAESDFDTCPAVLEAVQDAVDRQEFGYPARSRALAMATAEFWDRRYGTSLDTRLIHPVPDVVRGVILAIEALTRPDTPVVLPVPAYMPFFDVLAVTKREGIFLPVDGPDIDLDAVEKAFAGGAGAIILCHPYNPLGFSWPENTIAAIAAIAERHGGRVISDEIHAPVVLEGRHVSAHTVSPAARRVTATVTATSKGWNTAGLKCAQVILHNDADEDAWRALPHEAKTGVSTLGIAAAVGAYRNGEEWLEEQLVVLRSNRDLLADALPAAVPGIGIRHTTATYLQWLDFTAVEALGGRDPQRFLLDEAKVAVNPGPAFGEGGQQCVRLNFATSPEILGEAIDRIGGAFSRLG